MVTHVSIITFVLVYARRTHKRVGVPAYVRRRATYTLHACHKHMPRAALVAAIRRVINFGFASVRARFFLRSSAYYRTHEKVKWNRRHRRRMRVRVRVRARCQRGGLTQHSNALVAPPPTRRQHSHAFPVRVHGFWGVEYTRVVLWMRV